MTVPSLKRIADSFELSRNCLGNMICLYPSTDPVRLTISPSLFFIVYPSRDRDDELYSSIHSCPASSPAGFNSTSVIEIAETGVKILEKKIHEPHPLETSDLFTAFAEVSVTFDTIAEYIGIVFAYMPSHIEVIQPENLALRNTDLNEIAGIIIQRLHSYDALVKGVMNERSALAAKLKEVAPHLFKEEQESAPKTSEEPAPEKEK